MSQQALPDHPRKKEIDRSTEAAPHESPPWGLAIKVIVAVVVLLLSVLVIWRFQSLIAPLVLASILAYLLNPLITLAVRRLKVGRGVAALIVYGLLLLIAIGGGVALGYVAFDQASRLFELLPNNFEDAAQIFQQEFSDLAQRTIAIGPYTVGLTQLPEGMSLQNIVQQIVDVLRPIFSGGGTLAATVAQATISGISIGFLVFVLSIYIAKDSPKIWSTISDLATQPGYRQDADRLLAEFSRTWDAYLRGQVILALVIGIVVSLVLSLLGVNNALGLGALSGILEFLPIIGPFVGTSAAVLIAFFQSETIWGLESWQYALLIVALMGLIQALENNILVPRIVGDALDLHPLLVMISVLMGASLAGILGAVLAAPVVATIKLLGSYAWRKMLDLPPFPESLAIAQARAAPTSPWQRLLQMGSWLTDLWTGGKSTQTKPKAPASSGDAPSKESTTQRRKSNKKR